MSRSRFAPARTRWLLIATLVVAMIVPLHGGGGSASASPSTWQSDFGGGTSAAFRSIGDGLPSTGWNGRSNVSFERHAGRDALRMELPRDAREGMKVRSRFSELGFEARPGVRLQYDVFVAAERDLGLDLKLPGIASAPASESIWYAASGGVKQADSSSMRLHLRPAGHWGMSHPYLEAYTYAHQGGGKSFQDWGLYWRLADGLNASGSARGDEFRVPIGQWFTVTMEAEMNSPGRRDGELRVWLDGRKGIDISDMEWVRSAPYLWTQTMFEAFYNSGSHPEATLRLANMSMTSIGGTTPTPKPEPEPAAPPVATFAYHPTNPAPGQPVTLDASASERAVAWDWDDAAAGDWPLGSGESITFTFQNPGTKYVRLRVTDDQGRTNTTTQPIEVTAGQPEPEPEPAAPPVAAFAYHPINPAPSQPVTLDASASERAASWDWDDAAPGDWPLGTGETITFTFRNEGTKLVRLQVTDNQGRTDTIMQPIEVTAAPSARDRFTFDGGREGWGPGQSGDLVSHNRSVTHEGAGSLRGRTRFASNRTGTLRFRSEARLGDWSGSGGELGAWVYVPANAGGSGWQARIEVQNSSTYAYSNGALRSLTPGSWTYVSDDFGQVLRDVHRIVVHVQAWNVGGDRNVYVDTVRQR